MAGRYVYEDGIDRPRCMDRADIADVNGNQNTTEVLRFHYHQQALGSVTEVTQPTGAVVEGVTYDVYGQPTIRDQQGNGITQSAIGNPYLFTGREYDGAMGRYSYRARAYDANLGRFLQRDSLEFASGVSLYEYAASSPFVYTDPTGRILAIPSASRIPGSLSPPTPDAQAKEDVEKAAAVAGLVVVAWYYLPSMNMWTPEFQRRQLGHCVSDGVARGMIEYLHSLDTIVPLVGGKGFGPHGYSGESRVEYGGSGWNRIWALIHEIAHRFLRETYSRLAYKKAIEEGKSNEDAEKLAVEAGKEAERHDKSKGRKDATELERMARGEAGAEDVDHGPDGYHGHASGEVMHPRRVPPKGYNRPGNS